jgi:hypothetical protein
MGPGPPGRIGTPVKTAAEALRVSACVPPAVAAARFRPVPTLSVRPSRADVERSVEVRAVRPDAVRRQPGEGSRCRCPNVFPAPTEISATAGFVASSSASVVAVRLPWWATLSRSTVGSPRATSTGSTPSSMSPVRRNRCEPTEPSSTIETSLIPVPVSGGARGTAPGSGQSTRKETPSSANRSPVDSRSLRIPVAESAASNAAYPDPGPVIPGSNTRPTR